MFLFLNRLMKLGVVGLWLAGGYWIWTQRERGLPIWDYYQVWDAAGRKDPEVLPIFEGTVVRAVTDTGVFVRDGQGRIWSFGLIGVHPTSQNPRSKEFSDATRIQLEERLAGHEVRLAITSTNAQRTGFGYLYEGTNQVGLAVEMVAEGRWHLHSESGRVLPLKEQMRLRAADRQAQSKRRGLWADGMPGVMKPDTE